MFRFLRNEIILDITSPGSLNHISGCNLCGCCFFAINSSIVLSSSSIELSLSDEELLQASDL